MRNAFHSGSKTGGKWDDAGSWNGGCWRIEAWMFEFRYCMRGMIEMNRYEMSDL